MRWRKESINGLVLETLVKWLVKTNRVLENEPQMKLVSGLWIWYVFTASETILARQAGTMQNIEVSAQWDHGQSHWFL